MYKEIKNIKEKPSSLIYSLLKPDKDVLNANSVLTLKTINPEGAEDIESTIIRAFRSDMVKDRITESDLLNLIERDKEARAQQKEFVS